MLQAKLAQRRREAAVQLRMTNSKRYVIPCGRMSCDQIRRPVLDRRRRMRHVHIAGGNVMEAAQFRAVEFRRHPRERVLERLCRSSRLNVSSLCGRRDCHGCIRHALSRCLLGAADFLERAAAEFLKPTTEARRTAWSPVRAGAIGLRRRTRDCMLVSTASSGGHISWQQRPKEFAATLCKILG
jgi:hypothetical protein